MSGRYDLSPHPLPHWKRSPPDTMFAFSRMFTWREEDPQDLVSSHGLSAAYFEETTTHRAKPVPPSSLLICLPHQQDSCIFPSSRWMGVWMGRVKVQLNLAAPVPPPPLPCQGCPLWSSALLLPQQQTIQTLFKRKKKKRLSHNTSTPQRASFSSFPVTYFL